jgi:hypothetical protein
VKPYATMLTVDINRKGVLDVDVVKGCSAGVEAHGPRGCYQACYAASIAKYRGIDFSRSMVRKVYASAQARQIERAVRTSPLGFFRIGTMGDPCHDWEETVRTVEWLAPYAIPVIITKHWHRATDDQFARLVRCGSIINTSVSGLDSSRHLAHRLGEIRRYAEAGGTSITRVVSCDFNGDDPAGAIMRRTQEALFAMRPMIDNPLRVAANHQLVTAGIIRLRKVQDLSAVRTVSIAADSLTYLGHCSRCEDLCGAGLLDKADARPSHPQLSLFN